MTTVVTTKQALTVVRLTLLDKPPQYIADVTCLPVASVRELGAKYGAPDRAALADAQKALGAKLAKATAAQPSPAAAPSSTDGYTELLDEAAKSTRKTTRAMAERIRKDLDRLSDRFEEQSAAAARRRQAEQERASLRADEARLKKQLAEVQARLRGKSGSAAEPSAEAPKREASAPARDFDAKVVRAWAAENGVDCNATGRVRADVVDAWREATQGRESEAAS